MDEYPGLITQISPFRLLSIPELKASKRIHKLSELSIQRMGLFKKGDQGMPR